MLKGPICYIILVFYFFPDCVGLCKMVPFSSLFLSHFLRLQYVSVGLNLCRLNRWIYVIVFLQHQKNTEFKDSFKELQDFVELAAYRNNISTQHYV